MRRHYALLSCLGLILLPAALRAAPRTQADEAEHYRRPTVAISDFTGDDKPMGAFLSDTLVTDLGHSERLQTLERAELHQAATDLDIRESGPVTPSQVRHLGELIHASRLIVGSFLVRDDQVVINARLLDTHTGLNVPGSSLNVTGSRKNLLTVTHKLAHQLHRKLTGEDLVLDEEIPVAAMISDVREKEPVLIPQEEQDALDNGKKLGLIPAAARANGALAERDLAAFVGRLSKHISTDNVLHLAPAVAPVSRMQALTAIVKLIVSNADLAAFKSIGPNELTPDGAQVPLWGQPYLAAALDQGWWDAGTPFHPREAATWGFLQQVLAKLPVRDDAPLPIAVRPREEAPIVHELFTGLVVDVRDFDLKRDRSPRIVDEDGNEVYPDAKHCPTPDYVDEHGTAAYATAENDSHRSGSHPLVVRAVAVTGPGPFDVVVSNDDAHKIIEANRRSKFLWKWTVTLVVGEH